MCFVAINSGFILHWIRLELFKWEFDLMIFFGEFVVRFDGKWGWAYCARAYCARAKKNHRPIMRTKSNVFGTIQIRLFFSIFFSIWHINVNVCVSANTRCCDICFISGSINNNCWINIRQHHYSNKSVCRHHLSYSELNFLYIMQMNDSNRLYQTICMLDIIYVDRFSLYMLIGQNDGACLHIID